MTNANSLEPAGRDISISMERANVLAAWILPAAAIATLLPFWLVWGGAELKAGFQATLTLWIIPGMVAVVIIHEGLHGLAFLLSGVPRDQIHFGIHRETLTPFAGCRIPVNAAAYRFAVALPALAMGVVPWLVAMVTGTGWLAIVAMAMIAFAGGDLIVLWTTRSLPGTARVLDHPNRVGCMVVDG